MIDLTKSNLPSPLLHLVDFDPGVRWRKDASVAIEAPPDEDVIPQPEARWSKDAVRTGICGAVSPRVLRLHDGTYRMYYSQMLPRDGHPAGANDYDHATTRILSAVSADGAAWLPEPGVRLSSHEGGAGDYRVVSSEVAPATDGGFRMYYECCRGPQSIQNSILSAYSSDGLDWRLEPGVRLELAGRNLASPRIVHFPDGTCRLYCLDRGRGIISAGSSDGLNFRVEPGLRVAQGDALDALTAFAPEIVQVANAGYVMYYAGYSAANRAHILRAESDNGLDWRKSFAAVISPGGRWDAAKCSEMCVYPLPSNAGPRYRMVYEACDGTAVNERGVWRIASATSTSE
jgi:hypothetical protein